MKIAIDIQDMFEQWAKEKGYDCKRWSHPQKHYPYTDYHLNYHFHAFVAGFKQGQKSITYSCDSVKQCLDAEIKE